MSDYQNRLDAVENMYFRRQLEFIDKNVYEALYPDNKGRQLIPSIEGIPDTAPSYSYSMIERFGRAKIGGDMGDDAPRVEVTRTESTAQVIQNVTAAYGYNLLEIREAARVSTPLDGLRAKAARDTIETTIDEILATGSAAHGLKGVLNLTGVNTYTLGTKAASGTKSWLNGATPNEITKDVFGMATKIVNQLKDAAGPAWHSFTLAVPVEQFSHIAQAKMGDGDSSTILKFVLTNSPYVKEIIPWSRCDGAGVGGDDRALMFVKDPKVVGAIVPMEFTTQPPEQRNLNFLINCLARCGGVITRYPIAMQYADGL